jgi:hypothetical protein
VSPWRGTLFAGVAENYDNVRQEEEKHRGKKYPLPIQGHGRSGTALSLLTDEALTALV